MALGLSLMLVNRLVGLVLPASTKFLVDDVIGKGQAQLLWPLAGAVALATLVEAVTSFTLSQVLGVAAQRAITEMRRSVQAHVARLPVRYFDTVQTGVLISRVMTRRRGHPQPRRHAASSSSPAASSRRSSRSACCST